MRATGQRQVEQGGRTVTVITFHDWQHRHSTRDNRDAIATRYIHDLENIYNNLWRLFYIKLKKKVLHFDKCHHLQGEMGTFK